MYRICTVRMWIPNKHRNTSVTQIGTIFLLVDTGKHCFCVQIDGSELFFNTFRCTKCHTKSVKKALDASSSCQTPINCRMPSNESHRFWALLTFASRCCRVASQESLPGIRICPNHGAAGILFAISNPLNVHDVWLWSVDQMCRCTGPLLINGYRGVVPRILEVMSAKWKWTQLTQIHTHIRTSMVRSWTTHRHRAAFTWANEAVQIMANTYTRMVVWVKCINFNWRINFNAPHRDARSHKPYGFFDGFLFLISFLLLFLFAAALDAY